MISLDSYCTTVGSVFNTKSIVAAIKKSIIMDRLDTVSLDVEPLNEVRPVFITGINPSESDISLFTHPISVFNFNGASYLCTDLRLYIKKGIDLTDIEGSIKNVTEYNFAKSRAILNLLWLTKDRDMLKQSMSFASVIYSTWLSEVISKAYALDYNDQTTIAIISSYFYQTLFSDDIPNEEEVQKMAVHTIKATGAEAKEVFAIFDKLGPMENLEDYISNVVNIVENVRLKDLNLPVLLTLVKNSWYGTNAKEILSVSLELPCSWMAVVFTSLTEKTFKNSMISRLTDRLGKRGRADEFLTNYKLIVTDLKAATEDLTIPEFE